MHHILTYTILEKRWKNALEAGDEKGSREDEEK
jgi:hypothetical protein